MAANQVRQSMPDAKFLPLMIFLKKLFNFMSITSSVSSRITFITIKVTLEVCLLLVHLNKYLIHSQASGSIRGLKATAIALRFFAQADPASDEELKRLIPD